MAAAIPYVIAASAAISAYSAIRQGKAAEAAGEYNATVNTQNAQLARQEALDLSKQQERENYLRLGAIRANQGKAGGAAGEGSVLDFMADVAAQGELEKQNIIYQGELKARGFTNTAALDRFGGQQAKSQSYLKAGAELLGGAADAYTTNKKLSRT